LHAHLLLEIVFSCHMHSRLHIDPLITHMMA
jgi:hypothetical protein